MTDHLNTCEQTCRNYIGHAPHCPTKEGASLPASWRDDYDGEPRSDFSDGRDDEESDSARWRAEQRLKNQDY